VDWDRVVIETPGAGVGSRRTEIPLEDPCGDTRAENEHLFTDGAVTAAPPTGADAPTPRRTT
jgi:hypothetical protein